MVAEWTEFAYEREARRLLRRSERQYPEWSPHEALLREAGGTSVLCDATVRRYRPSYRAALEIILSDSPSDAADLETEFEAICTALKERSGEPYPPRGSSIKVLDATRIEAEATFKLLQARALKSRNPNTIAAALYTLVVPRIAVRPIELLDIVVDEWSMAIIRNAKRKRGQESHRGISLKRFSASFVAATKLLSLLARAAVLAKPHLQAEEAFERWRDAVAEALARASIEACGRRLSLYSFRHVGIATWKAAGFSASEIAAVAGHLSVKTAWRHYAPASSGWTSERALAEPVRVAFKKVGQENLTGSGKAEESATLRAPAAGSKIDALEVGDTPEQLASRSVGTSATVINAELDNWIEDMPVPSRNPLTPRTDKIDWTAYRQKADRDADDMKRRAATLGRDPLGEHREDARKIATSRRSRLTR